MGVIRLTEDMFKAKEEVLSEFDKSIFQECYVQASKVLVEIVKNNSKVKQDISKSKNPSINKSVEYHNNIIAFAGDRGSGKTSSMVSFHKSLDFENNKDTPNSLEDNFELKNNYIELEKYHFHLPYMIDPSVLAHKDSIIEIIVGRMFEEVSNDKRYDDVVRKRELIKKFDKVFKNLRIINTEQNNIFEQSQDNLEILMDLASVIDLKDNLYQLFECYMEYMNKDGLKKDNYLVIAIDDLDMNMASADKMIEDIRKYLIIPNVVILIALRMPQMVEVVQQRNMMQLKETTEFYYKMDQKNKTLEYLDEHYCDINTKTHRYLEKIFPETHIIYMPYIWSENIDVKLKINDKESDAFKINDFIKILFEYSIGYVIGTEIHLRAILPQNLRGFIELVEVLDYKNIYKDIINKSPVKQVERLDYQAIYNRIDKTQGLQKETILKDVKTIQKYYKDRFLIRVNNTELRNILLVIMEEDITVLNKKLLLNLVDLLYRKYDLNKDNKEVGENERIDDTLEYIQKINRNRLNIERTSVNIGDILCLLKIYEQSELNTNEQTFYELFKLFYTMRFIEFVSNLDDTKESDIETYNGFVYDMVGRYFYIENSKSNSLKTYLKSKRQIKQCIVWD